MASFPSSQIWTLKDHAKVVRGDIVYPTVSEGSSVWKMREASTARSVGVYPNDDIVATEGYNYAQSYIATTGGSITTVTSAGSINTALNNLSDGDVLLLASGNTYTVTSEATDGYGNDPWRHKNVLICGDTDDAANVVLEWTKAAGRGMHIFGGGDSTHVPTVNKQSAFVTWYTQQTSETSYINALVAQVASTGPAKGRLVNCYIDQSTGGISWHYNNGNLTTIDVEFIRCTFANYSSWYESYSGRDDVITVTDCLFDDSTDTTEYVNGGGNTTGATVDTTNRSYNTGTYTSSGHLYIPNTTAVF